MKISKVFYLLPIVLTLCSCNQPKDDNGPFTVSFDTNTNLTTTYVRNQVVEKGDKLKKPSVYVTDDNPRNQSVVGWCLNKECTSEMWDFDNDVVTKSFTLFAKWSFKFKVSYFVNGEEKASTFVFPNELASRNDGLAGEFELLGYYTDPEFKNEYDFSTPVIADLNLYLKLDLTNTTLKPESMINGYFNNYLTDAAASLSNDNEYAIINFNSKTYTSPYDNWYRIDSLNFDIKDKNEINITYKNLGKGNSLSLYYVVGYLQENGTYLYSNNGKRVTNGLFSTLHIPVVDIKKSMSLNDEWEVATIDVGAATIYDGISEWGTADILSHFRFNYNVLSSDKFENENDGTILIKDIKFSDNGKKYPIIMPNSISLDEESINLDIGESIKLNATVLPSDAYNTDIVWSSSNKDSVTVDENGKILAINEGTAIITARSVVSNNVYAECNVNVNPLDQEYVPVTAIELSYDQLTLNLVDTDVIYADVDFDATVQGVTFSIEDESIATIEQIDEYSALISPVHSGKTNIVATSLSKEKVVAKCPLEISKPDGYEGSYETLKFLDFSKYSDGDENAASASARRDWNQGLTISYSDDFEAYSFKSNSEFDYVYFFMNQGLMDSKPVQNAKSISVIYATGNTENIHFYYGQDGTNHYKDFIKLIYDGCWHTVTIDTADATNEKWPAMRLDVLNGTLYIKAIIINY